MNGSRIFKEAGHTIDTFIEQYRGFGHFEEEGYEYFGNRYGIAEGPIHALAPPLSSDELEEAFHAYPPLRDLNYSRELLSHNGCQLFFKRINFFGFWYLSHPSHPMKANIIWDIGAPNRENLVICREHRGQIIASFKESGIECFALEVSDAAIVGVSCSDGMRMHKWDSLNCFLADQAGSVAQIP